MADDEKTRKLRERLDAIKPQSNIVTSEEKPSDEHLKGNDEPRAVSKAWGKLGAFIGKNFAFWGAQYIVLSKLNVSPFLWWESVIILAGIIAVISNFKK
jgi:hypothetical protein